MENAVREKFKHDLEQKREQFEVKLRKFSDESERNKRTNLIVMINTTVMELFLIFLLGLQMLSEPGAYKLGPVVIALFALALAANWVVYLKDKESKQLRYVIPIGYGAGYTLLVMTGSNEYIAMYVIPILIGMILYFDRRIMNVSVAYYIAISVLRCAVTILMSSDNVTSTITSTGVLIVILVSILCVAYTIIRFDYDAMNTMRDEQKLQKIMVDEIMVVVAEMQEEMDKVDAVVDHLKESSEVVYNSMQEIAVSTQVTADNVQQQTLMTQNIQNAITDTADNAKTIVDIAGNSGRTVEESMRVMEEMKHQSEEIGKTNAGVAESMRQLQDKAKEVQEITSVIFTIASQTNLLALNASIESARAGDAGRGFAVVADQIRQLAEQTRQSTERISSIVQELNVNATEAATVVQESLTSAEQQRGLIETASESFQVISKDVDVLTGKIREIDGQIKNLVTANDTIIDSISQLSATSEEVMASAQEAENRSGENKEEADEARALLTQVNQTVERLRKYQKN